MTYGQCNECACRRNDGKVSVTYETDGGTNETVCEDILCSLNEYHVSNHACVPCNDGEVNVGGDNAAGEDTFCDVAGCTDPLANNYNANAQAEDFSCTYDVSFVANLRCAGLDSRPVSMFFGALRAVLRPTLLHSLMMMVMVCGWGRQRQPMAIMCLPTRNLCQ